MKTWIMVRHAKSAWNYQVSDMNRHLIERGVNDAHIVGVHLAKQDLDIEKVFSSPANRALHTCMIMMRSMKVAYEKLSITQELYDFEGTEVYDFITSLSNHHHTIMTFGHNYACTELAFKLGGFKKDNIPTAAAFIFRFDVSSWEEIKTCQGELITPKMLRE